MNTENDTTLDTDEADADIESILSQISWPEGLDEQTFLDQYWQRKPLLLKQALPDFQTPISPDELAGLAVDEDTTPRLIRHKPDEDSYSLLYGPFHESVFSELTDNHWSLLVTDVEKHIPEMADYLVPFQFLPSWRIDDLMISYAPDGASVGAHVDDYDVFLLQASGTREWSIDSAPNPDLTLQENATLKLLANFKPNEVYLLEPGDILYLPPRVPHHGVAVGEDCTTWSIGFRAPSVADIVNDIAEMVAEKISSLANEQVGEQRYQDPALTVATPGELSSQSIQVFSDLWRQATNLSDKELALYAGKLASKPMPFDVERSDEHRLLSTSPFWVKHPFCRFVYTVVDTGVLAEAHAATASSQDSAIINNHDDTQRCTLFVDAEPRPCSVALAQALCAGDAIDPSELEEKDRLTVSNLVSDGFMLPCEFECDADCDHEHHHH